MQNALDLLKFMKQISLSAQNCISERSHVEIINILGILLNELLACSSSSELKTARCVFFLDLCVLFIAEAKPSVQKVLLPSVLDVVYLNKSQYSVQQRKKKSTCLILISLSVAVYRVPIFCVDKNILGLLPPLEKLSKFIL